MATRLFDRGLFLAILLFWIIRIGRTQQYEDEESLKLTRWTSDVQLNSIFYDKPTQRIYVGAQNTIYQVDATNVSNVIRQIEWKPDPIVVQTCINYKGVNGMCSNSIRVLHSVNSTHMYACGTMAYNPACCYIMKDILVILPWTITNTDMKSPHDPFTSSVSIIANETLFTATRGSLMGNDGIISKALNGHDLRTPDGDKFWLYEPEFVSMQHARAEDPIDDKLLVFFRELAEEFRPFDLGLSRDPSERLQVTRVASLCLNDHGGTTWVLNRKFATFRKMTLTCTSDNGDAMASNFRYDNLVSTYTVDNPTDPFNPKIYALFSSPRGATAGAAVCTFDTSSLLQALDGELYWGRPLRGESTKVRYDSRQGPPPGHCVGETKDLKPTRLMFGERYPLKFGGIYPSTARPMFQAPGTRFHHIVAQVVPGSVSGLDDDVTVLFMATDGGKLKRVVLSQARSEKWELPDLDILENEPKDRNDKVLKLVLQRHNMVIMTNRSVINVPLAQCSLYRGCNLCVGARDPFCAWTSAAGGRCKSVFELSDAEKEAMTDFSCPPQDNPRPDLVTELRANVTILLARELDRQGELAELREDSKRCRSLREEFDETVGNLTVVLNSKKDEFEIAKRKQNSLDQQLTLCKKRILLTAAKAKKAWLQATQNPRESEMARTIKRLQLRNDDQQLELLQCSGSLKRCSEQRTSTNESILLMEQKMSRMEVDCAKQKQDAAISLRSQVNVLRNVSIQMRRDLATAKTRRPPGCNESEAVTSCYRKVVSVRRDVTHLLKVNRNMSKDVATLRRQHEHNVQLIRQLSWLHRKNGERGQQSCDYNGWFMSNQSGNLYKLGKERMGFLQAKTFCANSGAILAVFKKAGELRYVNNVVRAFSQRQPFWIGLVKYRNGSLKWQDGSTMQSSDLERFPRSQQGRMRRSNIYCVEVNQKQRWSLMPCQRRRRPICQKVMTGATLRPKDDRLFQVLVKT